MNMIGDTMNDYEEDEEEIWKKPYPKQIATTGTYTSMATSGQAVGNVFGESQPEFKEIFQKREKKMNRICDNCGRLGDTVQIVSLRFPRGWRFWKKYTILTKFCTFRCLFEYCQKGQVKK